MVLLLHTIRFVFVLSSGGWVKIERKLAALPHIKFVPCVNLTRCWITNVRAVEGATPEEGVISPRAVWRFARSTSLL